MHGLETRMPSTRAEVTSWALVDPRLRSLPVRPWALEDALRVLLDGPPTRLHGRLREWATESVWGWRFPALIEVQWDLVRAGALVEAPERRPAPRYLVDPWWQDQRRHQLAAWTEAEIATVMVASDHLVSLCASSTS